MMSYPLDPDDDDAVEACPACNYTGIKPRTRKLPKYRCKACGEEFSEPHVRPSRQGGKENYAG